MNKKLMSLLGLALASLLAVSCGSSTSTDPDSGVGPGVTYDAAPTETLYPLSEGTYCYDVTAISAVADGCGIAPGAVVGLALPASYTTPTFVLGTEGSLGQGNLAHNTGTLLRDGSTSDSAAPTCNWHQMDTTVVTLTAQNTFTASVIETQDTFALACGATAPAAGSCTSSWTWTMVINSKKTPPACN
jgi:hypothetical protein